MTKPDETKSTGHKSKADASLHTQNDNENSIDAESDAQPSNTKTTSETPDNGATRKQRRPTYSATRLSGDPIHGSEPEDEMADNMSGGNVFQQDKEESGEAKNDQEADYKNLTFHNITNSLKPNFDSKRRPSFYDISNIGNALKKKLYTSSNGHDPDAEKVLRIAEQIDENENVKDMSSDLIDTLIAGCPAALLSMTQMLFDDHNVQRAALLLGILSVTVNPIEVSGNTKYNKDSKFKVDLEYGVGNNRLKWSVFKSYRDFASLHGKFKAISLQDMLNDKFHVGHSSRKLLIPKFPRQMRKKNYQNSHLNVPQQNNEFQDNSSMQTSNQSALGTINSKITTDPNLIFIPQKRNIFFKHLQKFNNDSELDDSDLPMHQRIEKYLKILNLALSLRPVANKLFQFYEVSPIGILLSYETGYAGKQGYSVMASSASGNGWRVSHFKINDWKAMLTRHTSKWFLVRHSYIMYVSDIHSTTPLDIFLVDSHFKIKNSFDKIENEKDKSIKQKSKIKNKFQLVLQNSEREMKLLFSKEQYMREWYDSILEMAKKTQWSMRNRFDSFAPVRQNCYCKFLVDGRDYFWALSEALSMAQDCIYIHDWWLSPELYMRRPVTGNEQYRLDRILAERASKGVKIFIIVYRNVGSTVGTDSSWTKHTMINLHPNIHVIRSPNQWLQNTYFWAHHEKLAMIDHSIAFIGGIDLCYGRYDTPEHVLRDEGKEIVDQIFPGKDYSNARRNDFYDLEKPFVSMYDRNVVPRMPWHDVQMMTIGEIARDLSRHFVQRWNYLLRQKRPSRPTPLLTPPSDFTDAELKNSPLFQLIKDKSTCECQLLRSTGDWSLGLKKTEHSIHNAYLKMIETSKHYMYIENQFFVTSSEVEGVVIENKIGDAIVDRILLASQLKQKWKAFILIPLMPGFDSEIDHPDGSSLRTIMYCQYISICRGENSIFGKLKKFGIEPMDYIQFYSLRKWSEIGPNNRLVSEQLYVHGKVLIVDDRSCIIGSANVNERSMAGDRDSEVAILIRDRDEVKSKMDGKDYMAGRFAFELRQRLMREHIGCDVDLIEMVERQFGRFQNLAKENFETLHTVSDVSKKDEKRDENDNEIYVVSSSIELAMREVLDIDFTTKWQKIHGDLSNFGVNDNSDKKNEKTEKDEKLQLPSEPVFVSACHTFNNRVGEANLGIKDDKPISTDPRVDIKSLKNPDNYDPDKTFDKVKYLNDVGKQFNNMVFETFQRKKKKRSKTYNSADELHENRNTCDFLPNKEDIIAYIDNGNVDDVSRWDLLKRVCYLQHLALKDERKKVLPTDKKDDNDTPNKEKGSKNSKHTVVNANSKPAHILKNLILRDEEIDQILAYVSVPNQLNPKLKKTDIHENYDNESISSDSYSLNSSANESTISTTGSNTNETLSHNGETDNSRTTVEGEGAGKYQKPPDVDEMFIDATFVDPYSFTDPLVNSFCQDLWYSIARRNSYIFRLVFHCHPDDSVSSWSDYKEFNNLNEEFNELQEEIEEIESKMTIKRKKSGKRGSKNGTSGVDGDMEEYEMIEECGTDDKEHLFRTRLSRNAMNGFDKKVYDKYSAKKLLQRIHGHLVLFPYHWLEKEHDNNNWYYTTDRLTPIQIYD